MAGALERRLENQARASSSVWLRHELFCARLPSATYDYSERSLARFLQAHALGKPHLVPVTSSAVFENACVGTVTLAVHGEDSPYPIDRIRRDVVRPAQFANRLLLRPSACVKLPVMQAVEQVLGKK